MAWTPQPPGSVAKYRLSSTAFGLPTCSSAACEQVISSLSDALAAKSSMHVWRWAIQDGSNPFRAWQRRSGVGSNLAKSSGARRQITSINGECQSSSSRACISPPRRSLLRVLPRSARTPYRGPAHFENALSPKIARSEVEPGQELGHLVSAIGVAFTEIELV